MNLPALSVRRRVAFLMVFIAMLGTGIFGLTQLGVDMYPDMEYPMIDQYSGISWWENLGNGLSWEKHVIYEEPEEVWGMGSLDVSDYDGDGDYDAVGGSGDKIDQLRCPPRASHQPCAHLWRPHGRQQEMRGQGTLSRRELSGRSQETCL